MNIEKKINEKSLTLVIEGRLDTGTAPELEAVIDSSLSGVDELIMDLLKLEYVSSAGLRVILKAQKTMNAQGTMKICNANESIMEVFEITGFSDILTIE